MDQGDSKSYRQGLVSVIIPVLNRAHLVVQAIESVRAQTWSEVEIIVVDDGSSDNIREVVEPYKDVLFLSQEWQGQPAARNLGLHQAQGEYICSLDSDDLWCPTFLEKSIHALLELNADFVFSNWSEQQADQTVCLSNFERYYFWWHFPITGVNGWRLMAPEAARAMYLDSCVSPSSSLVFRRERMAGSWTPGLLIADDWCILLDTILSRPCRVGFTMQRLWTKRVTGDNICDGQNPFEIRRKLWNKDFSFLFDRLRAKLTRAESGKFSRRLAVNSLELMRSQWIVGNSAASLQAAGMMIKALANAVAAAPITFVQKLIRNEVYQFPQASAEDLEREVYSANEL